MDRRYPNPLPHIHAIPEYRATGTLKHQYDHVKDAMQVPWMGVVTMAYAQYPVFFEYLWEGAAPLVRSRPFVEASIALRRSVEAEAAQLKPTPMASRLEEAGYADIEIEQIQEVLEIFSHGNYLYLLLATVVRTLLEGQNMLGGTDASPYSGRHAPDVHAPLVLMESHHADAPTRQIYEELKSVLRLPFVNTDYRALARWPSYFALAWIGLRRVVTTQRYDAMCQAVHQNVAHWVLHELPNPGRLSAAALREAGGRDASLGEVLQVSRLFQWLLPGLVTNIAYLRAQLRQ